jgi:hypothetical protein
LHAAQRRVQRSSTAGCSRLRPTNCSTLLTVA